MRKFLVKLFVIISFIGFNSNLFSQNVTVKASIDSSKILIGDQVKLSLEVTQPKGVKVGFPLLKDSIISKVEVVSNLPIDTAYSKDSASYILTQKYILTGFDSGYYVLPPLKFMVNNDSVFTEAIELFVSTLPVDTLKKPITDIKEPYDTPYSFGEFLLFLKDNWYFVVAILLLIGGVIFLIYYLKKRKKNEPILPKIEKPKEPAHVIALRELERIRLEKLWQKNKVKQYHIELTEAIRVYIEHRFEVPAMEQTSDEIISSFVHSNLINSTSLNSLKQILYLADLVKFAKLDPLADENDLSFKNAFNFVESTKAVEKIEIQEQSANLKNEQ